MITKPLVVVGGGPAGMAAAIEAGRAGLQCLLLDEAPAPGGQIYRAFPQDFRVEGPLGLGKDFVNGEALREQLKATAPAVETRSDVAVVNVSRGRELLWASGGATGSICAEQLILATGARDRAVPFPGWTLPGVLTAGGAQVMVKTYRVKPGSRALVAGTGPLLLVVANQLHQAGVEVAAVLEAGRPWISLSELPKLWGEWGLLRDAWTYWRGLQSAGIPLHFNHTVFEARGKDQVETVLYGPVDPVRWHPQKTAAQKVDVDLLVVGFGFVPNTELGYLAGCGHEYDDKVGGWIPIRDERMRTTVPGVYSVGDGAGVAGVLVAVEEGRIAGITAAEQAGLLSPIDAADRREPAEARLKSLQSVREVLDDISRIREGLLDLATPSTLVCRCEEVRLSAVQRAIDEGCKDLQSTKLFTRLGMGACQGRSCEPHLGAYLCQHLKRAPAAVGRINPQPPVRPVTFGTLAAAQETAEER
ncbi:MAG: FAD-dependent oxidoreductase [Myxococcales bacterium]|nr:FAD-dependent oxidoreductase [Myxococcales bacterium]